MYDFSFWSKCVKSIIYGNEKKAKMSRCVNKVFPKSHETILKELSALTKKKVDRFVEGDIV